MVSIWPQVEWNSENFEEMKQQGLLVKQNSGIDVQMTFHGNNVFMDATNPRTRKYVWEKCKKNYADIGVKTFWLDEAEPEFTNYNYERYQYHAGPVSKVGNIYPREYSKLFYEGQKEIGQNDIVNLVRCAWVGSQRYGSLVWSGDIFSSYEDFRNILFEPKLLFFINDVGAKYLLPLTNAIYHHISMQFSKSCIIYLF